MCQDAFDGIKHKIASALVLMFLEFDKPFKIHTDASDYAIGVVLLQDGKPVALESKKLSQVERRWPNHGKELFAIVHYLKEWEHYLGMFEIKVFLGSISLKYLETQDKVFKKLLMWYDTIAISNVKIIHKPGKEIMVPHALSRKQEHMDLPIVWTLEWEDIDNKTSLEGAIRKGY